MGWCITIGNAELVKARDIDTLYHLDVPTIELDEAPFWPSNPSNPDASGKSNVRMPGYSSLAEFVRETGVSLDAFSAGGSNCDCYILRPADLAEVRRAKAAWIHEHPGADPGWLPGKDYTLAKLIWYEWWMDWALRNCECPAIQMG